MIIAIFYGLAILCAIWGVYSLLGYRSQKREWRRAMGQYYELNNQRKSFLVVLGDRFDQTPYAEKMRGKLHQANLPLTPSEFYGMLLVGGMGIAVVSTSMFQLAFPLNVMIAGGLIAIIYFALFAIRKNKYQERFDDQLSEVCRLLGNAARAGMTINQGIELAAREMVYPAGDELKRLAHELRLGVDFERALINTQNRIPSRDFKLFIATLLIQKRSGGNLHAILDEMSQTLEERKILNQTIKTMTAEQRYISYILPALPIFLILVMNTIVEGFLKPIATAPGMILMGLFLAGSVLTFFLIRKVTNIRV
ncbi:hypothetical protein BEP19_08830 [Ammoniphilus oxalaticus]|uniref:Type II secretion system protein GspF domain-containing protein n=1 Tax=Ammoniphilus oxalaticus TaxID=66863 RepID=A0A419SKK9_9BACL|nr:type II secretion system F family protein [Ammoniphilus oxalaticus]RKD24480.1 hypothetical protein BEP19_08830 [Ammoniphilus oxalaticus]